MVRPFRHGGPRRPCRTLPPQVRQRGTRREFGPMSTNDSGSHRLHFRVVHLLYVTALLASALATFGGPGLGLGIPTLAVWAYVFTSRQRPSALGRAGVRSFIICCVVGFFVMPLSPT